MIIGYLGIDNYTCYKEHPGFYDASYYLSNELAKMKLQKKQLYMHYHDDQVVLKSRKLSAILSGTHEERLISLGCSFIGYQWIADINHLYGNAYGDDISSVALHM